MAPSNLEVGASERPGVVHFLCRIDISRSRRRFEPSLPIFQTTTTKVPHALFLSQAEFSCRGYVLAEPCLDVSAERADNTHEWLSGATAGLSLKSGQFQPQPA